MGRDGRCHGRWTGHPADGPALAVRIHGAGTAHVGFRAEAGGGW